MGREACPELAEGPIPSPTREVPPPARTDMEIGKRLLEPESKYRELNGTNAEQYLENARTMFEELNLEWDLNELDKIEYQRA